MRITTARAGLGASTLGVLLTIGPLALTWSAWRASATLWAGVLASLPPWSGLHAFALSAAPTASLAGSLLIVAALAGAHQLHAAPRSAIVAALAGLVAAVGFVVGSEIERLAGFRPTQSWARIAAQFDLGVPVACAVGTFVLAAGVRLLRAGSGERLSGPG